jgi:hypothetical protein
MSGPQTEEPVNIELHFVSPTIIFTKLFSNSENVQAGEIAASLRWYIKAEPFQAFVVE